LAIRISSTALSCFLNSREQPLRKRVKRRKVTVISFYAALKKEMTERTLINDQYSIVTRKREKLKRHSLAKLILFT